MNAVALITIVTGDRGMLTRIPEQFLPRRTVDWKALIVWPQIASAGCRMNPETHYRTFDRKPNTGLSSRFSRLHSLAGSGFVGGAGRFTGASRHSEGVQKVYSRSGQGYGNQGAFPDSNV